MRLEITSIADTGDVSKERIVMKAVTDLDVGDFAVFKSSVGSTGQEPTAGRKAAYWFPDENVVTGDLVVLYTKRGSRSTKRLDSGGTVYFFYWGKDESQWGDSQSGVVLLEVADWQFRLPGKTS